MTRGAPQGVPCVLVVDDDDSIREITRIALEVVGGWQVTIASGGREALDLAEERDFDAVLLDVMMPEMDGPTTFAHLRERPATRDLPVVLLTAKVQTGDHQVWDRLDVAGVISKPFDPMTLAGDVAAMLGWSPQAS
ncbi:response regulator [Nocardioides sp. zg-DK7169]|uniref:response regulator n=1 Tax=Nocardioides sp. zg-DK7169 TaxID=2736600 RepID=UPI0015577629|nr:response regulator [Nocardioides sp. zg-DK7169]NPC99060.1 response regulator [Nocardioides sp. zg-DK7169]